MLVRFVEDLQLERRFGGCFMHTATDEKFAKDSVVEVDHVERVKRVKRRHAEGGPFTMDELHFGSDLSTNYDYVTVASDKYVVED